MAERAAAIWQQRYPGLTIAGAFAGSPRSAEDDALCERIRATQPNLLLVAYGAPAQDVWLARNMAKLARDDGGLVGIGVGGVFDYVTGVRPLAPRWMRAGRAGVVFSAGDATFALAPAAGPAAICRGGAGFAKSECLRSD